MVGSCAGCYALGQLSEAEWSYPVQIIFYVGQSSTQFVCLSAVIDHCVKYAQISLPWIIV